MLASGRSLFELSLDEMVQKYDEEDVEEEDNDDGLEEEEEDTVLDL